ncbi:uncharacterized protein N7515_005090 [Penicillium bovifimosum]|uniref:Uncharacterized protein n=1 Tax=Penicillium bovifimosum TaxID=126998 RepID=A0A9W9L4J4_9EURO|nr:uncharacterized protein N7515_005090 [Penicillium bovifimosum]KAJ5135812.1 hypothetical protein N7515_005090 [Penicillium bovifimosum]
MAGPKAWLSSRPLWAFITFILALICLLFVVKGISTDEQTKDTRYDLYRWKSRPTIKHDIFDPAISPTVEPNESSHLARRDSKISVGIPSSPAEDKPVQADSQTLEGHHDAKENQKDTPSGQVPDNDEAAIAQNIPESESKSLSETSPFPHKAA